MDVLTWLDSLHATDESGAVTNQKWAEAQEAREAIAELVAAAQAIAKGPRVGGSIANRQRLHAALRKATGTTP